MIFKELLDELSTLPCKCKIPLPANLCHEDQIYTLDLESYVSIGFWAVGGQEFNATCYLWLSEDKGRLPDHHVVEKEHEELLSALVR
jgi:hypothetical protein